MSDRVMPDFETCYTIWQDDDEQAGASDLAQAAHYAMIYGQDGPVELQTDVTFTFQGHLTREEVIAALSAAPTGEVEPTLFWDAEDWENGGSDPAEVVGNYAPGEVVKMDTAIHGPTRWGVMSPDGEVRVFPSADEAEAWFQSTILAAQEPRP